MQMAGMNFQTRSKVERKL
ncbi:hypothetical protein [Robinsoniella sp. RHS]